MPIQDDLEKIFPDQLKAFGFTRIAIIIIFVFFFVFIIALICLAAFLGNCKNASIDQKQFSQFQKKFACETSQCLHSASYMVDLMDETVDPCTDFYKFSCGNFQNKNPLGPDESELTMEIHLENEVEIKLRRLIDDHTTYYHKSESEQKLKDFYDMCVHEYGRSSDGAKSLMAQIKSSLGGWAVVDAEALWKGKKNLDQLIAAVQGELLVNVFFVTYIEKDTTLNKNIMSFYKPSNYLTPYSMFYYNTSSVITAYKLYIRDVGRLLARDSNVTALPTFAVEQFVDDVFNVERMISVNTRYLRGYDLYRTVSTTFAGLQKNFSHLGWLTVAQSMFPNLPLSMETPVRITGVPYFQVLEKLLTNSSWINKDRMLNNYFVWQIVTKYASDLSYEYRLAQSRFKGYWSGDSEWLPAWRECLTNVRERLGTLVLAEYARVHLSANAQQEARTIFTNLKAAMTSRVGQIQFMDEETKRRSKEKLNYLHDMIGFSDFYHNMTAIDLLHKDLVIDVDLSYFANFLRVLKFQRTLKTKLFTYTNEDFIKHGPIFGWDYHFWAFPYFFSSYNLLSVPAGGLIDPMFSASRPRVFNYGYLGTVMASEMVGTVGRRGKYVWTNNSYASWWTNSTRSEFEKTKNCFSSFFNTLTAGPYIIDGVNKTIDIKVQTLYTRYLEMIIELHGGIMAAFKAYKDLVKDDRDKPPSGLLKFSNDQIFFISAAQTKCYSRTDELNYEDVEDGYVPEDMQINGLLSHMNEFTEAFSCPLGSQMRSSYQCKAY